jgi:hypothetical protein
MVSGCIGAALRDRHAPARTSRRGRSRSGTGIRARCTCGGRGGGTNALRARLKAEQERGPDFLRFANAFSELYPKGSEERRLIDAMLLAVPR